MVLPRWDVSRLNQSPSVSLFVLIVDIAASDWVPTLQWPWFVPSRWRPIDCMRLTIAARILGFVVQTICHNGNSRASTQHTAAIEIALMMHNGKAAGGVFSSPMFLCFISVHYLRTTRTFCFRTASEINNHNVSAATSFDTQPWNPTTFQKYGNVDRECIELISPSQETCNGVE